MKSVVVFDTAVGTTNLGDEIILQCIENEMAFLLDESFVTRWGTHVRNLDAFRTVAGSPKLKFTDNADYKLIMGTNLLSRDIKRTRAQWAIDSIGSWLYSDCILVGVGTTLSEGAPTAYSEKIYKKILRKNFYHSVRDEESKRFLENMGFKAINTGCPTLWKLTPEFCKSIPQGKADRCIFSLSGFADQIDRDKDKELLDILKSCYKELIFWCQTTADEEYLDTFEGTDGIKRIYSLKKFEETLNEGNLDYVGTRLHGGVYALLHGVRSIVISIDHRARGFHDTNNLVICERNEISDKLKGMIDSEFETLIDLPIDGIKQFKDQFLQDNVVEGRTIHDNLPIVKAASAGKRAVKKLKKMI